MIAMIRTNPPTTPPAIAPVGDDEVFDPSLLPLAVFVGVPATTADIDTGDDRDGDRDEGVEDNVSEDEGAADEEGSMAWGSTVYTM